MNQAKIYVGNLSYTTSEDDLRDFFAEYGSIQDLKIIRDYQTGRSKGFAFVTFADSSAGESALAANGAELDGRKLNVNTAKDDNRRSGGGGGGGRA